MAIDSRIILAGRSPDIGAAFSNALLNVQRGQQFAQNREQSALNREQAPIRNRLLEAQAGQAEQGVIESGQLNNIRSLALFGRDIAGDTSIESIRAKTLQRISDVTGRGGNPGDSQELLATVIDNPDLTDEQKLAQVRSLSQQADQAAVQFGVLKAVGGGLSSGQRERADILKDLEGATDPTTGRLKPVDQLTVRQQEAAMAAGFLPRAVGSASQTITGAGTAGDVAATEATIAGGVAETLAGVELETAPTIAETVEAAKGRAQIKTEDIKQVAKINNSRIAELNQGGKARTSSTRKAKQFLRAIKDGKAFTGATRSAASFIPGVFTTQAEFDEKFNAFAEVAARQKLKASGELRPTDADVEGMKRAIFGIGRDENVNIQLLEEFISDQDDANDELDDLLSAKKRGDIGVFTRTVKPEDLVKLTDEDLFNF